MYIKLYQKLRHNPRDLGLLPWSCPRAGFLLQAATAECCSQSGGGVWQGRLQSGLYKHRHNPKDIGLLPMSCPPAGFHLQAATAECCSQSGGGAWQGRLKSVTYKVAKYAL